MLINVTISLAHDLPMQLRRSYCSFVPKWYVVPEWHEVIIGLGLFRHPLQRLTRPPAAHLQPESSKKWALRVTSITNWLSRRVTASLRADCREWDKSTLEERWRERPSHGSRGHSCRCRDISDIGTCESPGFLTCDILGRAVRKPQQTPFAGTILRVGLVRNRRNGATACDCS